MTGFSSSPFPQNVSDVRVILAVYWSDLDLRGDGVLWSRLTNESCVLDRIAAEGKLRKLMTSSELVCYCRGAIRSRVTTAAMNRVTVALQSLVYLISCVHITEVLQS